MKLKRFFVDKEAVRVFQDTDWPNAVAFILRMMLSCSIGADERDISAEVMMWADDGYWHRVACVPATTLAFDQFEEDFKEAVFKRLENHLDWYNVLDQSLCLLQTTTFYSDHFKPEPNSMKDILL